MKSKKIMIRNIITTLTIAALILIGSAPYFAFAEPTQQTDSEVVKLATFDDSKVPEVSGGSVVLMNAGNGDIIYEKNSHQLREPASVTKVLNFLTIADVLDPKEKVTIPEKVERGGTIVDLQPGEILTVEQLMYCMMLKSGNDAAEVLGNLAGGDQKGFSEMMNAKAKSVGALDTDYKNPNGLNETEGTLNYTTAYDQAMIAKAAMQKKIIRKVVGTVEYKIPKTNKYEERDLVNSNACLWNDKRTVVIGDKNIPLKYTGCTGMKTGFTTSAGACYVGTAKRGNMELIVVSLHAPDSSAAFADAIKLWDYGFDHYESIDVVRSDKPLLEQDVKHGALEKVKVGLAEDFAITVNKGYEAEGEFVTDIKLKEEKPTAPISKGAVMGTVEAYTHDGKLVGVKKLIALEKVEKGGPLSYIGIADENLWKVYLVVVLVFAALIAFLLLFRRHNLKKRAKRKAAKAARTRQTAGYATTSHHAVREEYEQPQRGPQLHREPPMRSEAARRSEAMVGTDRDRLRAEVSRRSEVFGEEPPERRPLTRREKRRARKARAKRRKKRNVRDQR